MSGDNGLFAHLYSSYYRHIYAYCRRRTDAASVDDAVADTFLVAWRRIADVPPGTAALPWLYAIAYRVLSHQWRSTGRQRRLDARLRAAGASTQPPLDDVVLVREEARKVREAARRLHPDQLEVLRLSAWEGLSHNEIAAAVGITPAAARQRLHRARRNLHREYGRLVTGSVTPTAEKQGDAQ